MSHKKTKMQGSYLKEVAISFCLNQKDIKPVDIAVFLNNLIKKIGLEPVDCHLNQLPPGFDIVYTMKESCAYFGYWGEIGFVRMYIISCKDFDISILKALINNDFTIKGRIKVDIIKNTSVFEEMKTLWKKA